MTPLFNSYVMVDWSAAAKPAPADPARANDAIWYAVAERKNNGFTYITQCRHCRTRSEAQERLADLLSDLSKRGRTLIGFDFPFGYPAGTAKALGLDGLKWRQTWATMGARLEDGPDNQNNRLEAAAALNRDAFQSKDGPFWGFPPSSKTGNPGLPIKKPRGFGDRLPPERRIAEQYAKGAESVWHVAGGAGVVGSQVLLGLPTVWTLRTDPELAEKTAIWPFETGLKDDPDAQIVIAEIWPSLLDHGTEEGVPKDSTQVRCVVEHFAMVDSEGKLGALLQGPKSLSQEERQKIEQEEAWILGLQEISKRYAVQPGKLPSPRRCSYDYIQDPSAIYEESFRQIDASIDLNNLPAKLHSVARRVVHACGRPDVLSAFDWAGDPTEAVFYAFQSKRTVFCDAEMVERGVIRRWLPKGVETSCTLNDTMTTALAEAHGTTRSAAAVELWKGALAGSVVLIGNAPTALFHLLERLSQGWPKPAAIIAMPVGFVGAAESKQALKDFSARSGVFIPFLTVQGREGGSAMAAAAFNAFLAEYKKREAA